MHRLDDTERTATHARMIRQPKRQSVVSDGNMSGMQASALLRQDEFPTLGSAPADALPNGGPYSGGPSYGIPPPAPNVPHQLSPWDAPPPGPYGKPGERKGFFEK